MHFVIRLPCTYVGYPLSQLSVAAFLRVISHIPVLKERALLHSADPGASRLTSTSLPDEQSQSRQPQPSSQTQRATDQQPSIDMMGPRPLRRFQRTPIEFKSLTYVGHVNENLTCPICYCPFDNPIRLPCDHFFCEDCIGEAVQSQPHGLQCCPVCRSSIDQSSTSAAPRIIKQMLDDLRVRCPSHRHGCDAEMPRSSVQDHIENECYYAEIECPVNHCPHWISRRDAQSRTCLHRLTTCDDCKQPLMGMCISNYPVALPR